MKMLTVSLLLISLFFLGAPTCSQKDAVADNRCREDSTAARITLDSLAHYFESELYSQALEMGKRAMALFESCPERNQLGIADTYNKLGRCQMQLGNMEEAVASFFMNLDIRRKLSVPDSVGLADSYNNLGSVHLSLWENAKAIDYFEQALAIRRKIYPEKNEKISEALHNLGIAYYNLGDYPRSLEYHSAATRMDEEILDESHESLGYDYMNTAIVYDEVGDYEKAIGLYLRALRIRKKANGEKSLRVASVLNNLGASYDSRGDFAEAEACYREALAIRQHAVDSPIEQVAETKSNLGILFLKTGLPDSALAYLQPALGIRLEFFDAGHPSIAESYNNLGLCYAQMGMPDTSLLYHRKALAQSLEKVGLEHPYTAQYARFLGEELARQQYYEASLGVLDTALMAAGYNNRQREKVNSTQECFLGLLAKARVLRRLYALRKDATLLEEAHEGLDEAVAFTENYINQGSKTSSKVSFYAETYPVLEEAMRNKLLKFEATADRRYLDQAFALAEKSRATTLAEAVRASQASRFKNIPGSLLNEEQQLRVEIGYWESEKKFLLDEGASITDDDLISIENEIVARQERYEQLIQRFEREYPDYYQLRYNVRAVSRQYVADSLLPPGQTLLEYFVGDSSIFLFVVKKDDFQMLRIKKDFPLNALVQQFREGIYSYYNTPPSKRTEALLAKSLEKYAGAARRLYQELLEPAEGLLTKSLLILPDGVLGYLPFEALLSEPVKDTAHFGAYPYLLNECQASYAFSATLLREMREKKHNLPAPKPLLAMAPFYRGDAAALAARIDEADPLALVSRNDSLATLPASGEEIAVISKLWNGTPWYGQEATLEKFREEASQYSILHLSTHGKADDRVGDYAYLAFGVPDEPQAFDKLYARDIYNLPLNADMAVLSACETGIGKLQRGEGIISLARAFAYAGAKSIVTSLWVVNDASTKSLMAYFYSFLQEGMPKDEALRLAKLKYLEINPGMNSHPFFWAGFIAIGDMRPVR